MNWLKRYLVGRLIAVVFFAGFHAYAAPGVGGAIGDTVHGLTSGKAG